MTKTRQIVFGVVAIVALVIAAILMTYGTPGYGWFLGISIACVLGLGW